ncbi:MAG: rod shape-determining protein MreC, partial [Herbaspirillum sp.]
MEYSSPPPLFKQGASARVKLIFFSLIAIVLLVVDARMSSLAMLRQVVGTALYPLQSAALAPRDALNTVRDYFISQTQLENENQRLRQQQVDTGRALQQAEFLTQENQHLRSVLKLSERL